MKRLVHIYTGDGKGKTTAAMGLAVRALGRGWTVGVIQFMKTGETGEVDFFRNVQNVEFKAFGHPGFVDPCNPTEEDRNAAETGFALAEDWVRDRRFDLVILDEILPAVHCGIISIERVATLLDNKPDVVELALTGRDAPQELIEKADLVSDIREVKHPFTKGVPVRRGIEF
jgi:cob(I)alamin adenosyltransferase